MRLLIRFMVFIIFFEVFFRIGGWFSQTIGDYQNLQRIKNTHAYHILCVGDSTTQHQYPRFLEKILNGAHRGLSFSVIDKGETAENSTMIVGQLEDNLNKYQPDMVILMLGVSDGKGIEMRKGLPSRNEQTWGDYFKSYQLLRFFYLHGVERVRAIINRLSLRFYSIRGDGHINLNPWALRNVPQAPILGDYYLSLATLDNQKGKFESAEKNYMKALALKPNDDAVLAGLGGLYKTFGLAEGNVRYMNLAKRYLLKALKVNPNNQMALNDMGWYSYSKEQNDEAIGYFKKSFGLNPHQTAEFSIIISLYMHQNRFNEAKNDLLKAIHDQPKELRFYQLGINLFTTMKDKVNLEKCQEAVKSINNGSYNDITKKSYLTAYEILKKRRIAMVCVQYPMVDVDQLKKMLDNADDVVFIDNERSFKEGVKHYGYEQYFEDMMAGNFGHCTDRGNELLAQNIANGILRYLLSPH